MGLLDVEILGNKHVVSCDDGQEAHVKYLVEKFSTKVEQLASGQKNAPILTLYLLAALIISDELENIKAKLLKQEHASGNDEAVAQALDMVVEYVENLANKFSR